MRFASILITIVLIFGFIAIMDPSLFNEGGGEEEPQEGRPSSFSPHDAQELLTRLKTLEEKAQKATEDARSEENTEAPSSPSSQTKEADTRAASEPIQRFDEENTGVLSSDEIFVWTNRARMRNDLGPFTKDPRLTHAALTKAQDILDRDYFAHTAPDGTRASDLADSSGYAYITIGENLALGNYEGSKAVVDAWMESPGHRANILSSAFEEIGVAALQGEYEGRTVWVAVQMFGSPKNACSEPDPQLRRNIETYREQVDEITAYLNETRPKIEEHENKRSPEYRKLVRDYNNAVERLHTLSRTLEEAVDTYNRQVNVYNQCLGEYTQ